MVTYNMKVYLKSGNILETEMVFKEVLSDLETKDTVKYFKDGFSFGGCSGKNEGVYVDGDSIEALTLTLA